MCLGALVALRTSPLHTRDIDTERTYRINCTFARSGSAAKVTPRSNQRNGRGETRKYPSRGCGGGGAAAAPSTDPGTEPSEAYLGWRDPARSRRLAREEAVEVVRRFEDSAVAGDVRLRAQDVEGLREQDARDGTGSRRQRIVRVKGGDERTWAPEEGGWGGWGGRGGGIEKEIYPLPQPTTVVQG